MLTFVIIAWFRVQLDRSQKSETKHPFSKKHINFIKLVEKE